MRGAPSGSSCGRAGDLVQMTTTSDTAVCAACAAIYPYAAWTSLSLVQSIEPAEIARLVRDWPVGVGIEVRRCARCGGSMARKRPVTEPVPTS
jgi:hypothetical protein